MPAYLCTTCSSQFAESAAPPAACPICEDERQYVPARGQGWTTLEALRRTHANTWRLLREDMYAILTVPAFGINQRAILVRTPAGNVLWDCLALLDEATIDLVRALGGITGVAISHPHYYSAMVEWGREFGVPVWLHADDRQHVMRPDPVLRFWEGEAQPLLPEVTLHRLGGHFAGGTVLHWDRGAGLLLSGDIIQVVPDRKNFGFMRSYPNLIPLPPQEVTRIAARCAGWRFDAVYGAFEGRELATGGAEALQRSARRYVDWVTRMVEP